MSFEHSFDELRKNWQNATKNGTINGTVNGTANNATNSTSNSTSDATKQEICVKTANITSFFGLKFDVHCDTDLYGDDLDHGTVPARSPRECLDLCTSRWGCYGATFSPQNEQCYFKTFQVLELGGMKPKENLTSMVASKEQLNQTDRDIACPFDNLSRQTSKSGLQFKIHCGATIIGDDLYDLKKDAFQFMHADNLTQCMNNCADLHPLCSRVTYDADTMLNLWFNCWLKTTSPIKAIPAVYKMRHSATAFLPTLRKPDCKNYTQDPLSWSRTFKTSCGDRRNVTDRAFPALTTVHKATLDECIQVCHDAKSDCASMVFDSSLEDGYRNCYVFNSTTSLPVSVKYDDRYAFMYWDQMGSLFHAPHVQAIDQSWKGLLAAEIAVPGFIGLALTAIGLWYWFWYRPRQRDLKYTMVKAD